MNVLDSIGNEQLRTDLPDFRPGDTVKVEVTEVATAEVK